MTTTSRVLYEFGAFRVDPDKQILLRENQPVAVPPKAFETLLILVRHSREVVSKDQLMKAVWPDTFVEEANLSQNIFLLRKALGETPEDRRYIVTLPGRGYRFAAEVRTVAEGSQDLLIASRSHSQMVIEESAALPDTAKPAAGNLFRASHWKYAVLIGAVLAVLAGSVFLLRTRRPVIFSETDTILLADFTNTTGDPVFDGTLREGLAVQLEQSPFLRLVSEDRIQQTLRMMGQPSETRLTTQIAREVCQRAAGSAVLDGSIAQIGTQYLLTLRAVNCASGESLASAGAPAIDKNHVLDALRKTASQMRNKLGESLSTVERFDIPLEQATTPSLEALKAFSSGSAVQSSQGEAASIPFYRRAIDLDPNFAMAYARLGIAYTSIGEPGMAVGYTRKAYELRERASEPEKYFISAIFQKEVTGDMAAAEQACKIWAQVYPRADAPHVYLSGAIYPVFGQYEKAVEEAREAIRLKPDTPISYAFLMFNYTYLNRPKEARATYGQAVQRNLHNGFYPLALYQIAFLQNDAAEMERQVASSQGQLGVEDQLMSLEADTAAYSGKFGDAREFSRQAMESAQRAGEKEVAGTYAALSVLREALFGTTDEARGQVILGPGVSSGRDAEYGAALALAFAGDNRRAQALTDDLGKKFPEDTIVQFNFLPTLRAKLALNRGDAGAAIENLRTATSYELGQTTASTYGWTALYPVFVRGEAYLASRQGAAAAAEFQKIMDYRSIVLNSPIGALAHLGLARAYVLSGDRTRARAKYQDFFALWKAADPNIPVLKRAMVEYEGLQ